VKPLWCSTTGSFQHPSYIKLSDLSRINNALKAATAEKLLGNTLLTHVGYSHGKRVWGYECTCSVTVTWPKLCIVGVIHCSFDNIKCSWWSSNYFASFGRYIFKV